MLIYDVMIQQSTEIHILGLKKNNNNNRKNNENFVKILGFNFYESLIPFSSSLVLVMAHSFMTDGYSS